MDIAQKLKQGHSRQIIDEIVHHIGDNENRFLQLLNCFMSNDNRLSQRASWALGNLSQLHPHLFDNHHRVFLNCFHDKKKHNAIRRNIVRIYQVAHIPEEYEAELYDICLNFIADNEEAIAVKAFSIRACERVIEKYPEMANELLTEIKSKIPNWSSGLKSRGNKFLKRWSD